jgi:hypothetical protein
VKPIGRIASEAWNAEYAKQPNALPLVAHRWEDLDDSMRRAWGAAAGAVQRATIDGTTRPGIEITGDIVLTEEKLRELLEAAFSRLDMGDSRSNTVDLLVGEARRCARGEPEVRALVDAARGVLRTGGNTTFDREDAIDDLEKALEAFGPSEPPCDVCGRSAGSAHDEVLARIERLSAPTERARLAHYSFSVGRENGVTSFYVNGERMVPAAALDLLRTQYGELVDAAGINATHRDAVEELRARRGKSLQTPKLDPARAQALLGPESDSEFFSFAEALMRMRQGKKVRRGDSRTIFFLRSDRFWTSYEGNEHEQSGGLANEAIVALDWTEVDEKPLVEKIASRHRAAMRDRAAMRAIADLLETIDKYDSIERKIAGVSIRRRDGGWWLWLPNRRGEGRTNPLDATVALLDLAELAEK